MHFSLLDQVIERTETTITTTKLVSRSEEYLQDHFAEFPVLPGVFMIEAMVQAARAMLEGEPNGGTTRMVLGGVRGVKYGRFVKPGETLVVTMEKLRVDSAAGTIEFKGQGVVRDGTGELIVGGDGQPATAVSGRLTMRRLRAGLAGD
jgi:3-hydroxyacyl-[acyl-carrier-protein] dehydratase